MALPAQAELQALLDCAPAFIIAVDRNGVIRFINRVLPGFDKHDVIGSNWLNYITENERAQMHVRLSSVFATGAPIDYDVTALGSDGHTRFFASQMSPLRSGADVIGVVITSQDVTELKRVEAELAAAQRLATVGTLAAGVAHEINTPIQFVSDNVQFLREATDSVLAVIQALQGLHSAVMAGAPAAELTAAAARASSAMDAADLDYLCSNVPEAIGACLHGLERVSNIVRSLREFAHPAQEHMARADLNRAIRSTLTVATNEYRHVADLELDLAELPDINCHIDEINQVVLNIVINAAHAIGDVVRVRGGRGTITVRTRPDGDHVVLAISDTGNGVPKAVQPRMFDPFFTTKDVGKGTGQGLAIARSIVVKKHGGQLTFETTEGKGTTFFIRLPVDSQRATHEAAAVAH